MATRTVLLVDDDTDLLDELQHALSRQGLWVITASNGQAALDEIQEVRPDVIVCDISMPGMNGLEVLERVRQMGTPSSTTPFIFLTGQSAIEDEIRGRSTGADDYLSKPVDVQRLNAIIQSRISQLERFQTATEELVAAARARLEQASTRRITAMQNALVELRPLLREASGANMQLISLMEGISDSVWTELANSTHVRLKQAQYLVRNAGILAAVPPAPLTIAPQRTTLSDIIADAITATSPRMKQGGTTVMTGDSSIVADPDALRSIAAAFIVWASERVPSAHIVFAAEDNTLLITTTSNHRTPQKIREAWTSASGDSNDPIEAVAGTLIDAVELHGAKCEMLSDEDAATLKIEFKTA